MVSSLLHPSLSSLIRFANSPSASKFIDVIIIVTDDSGRPIRRFEAHKLMLAAHSLFFARLFATCCTTNDDPITVLLPQADISHVQTAIDFVYGRNNSQAWKEKHEDELAAAARLMGIGNSSSVRENTKSFFARKPRQRRDYTDDITTNRHDEGNFTDFDDGGKRLGNGGGRGESFYYCCDRTFDSELFYASHKEYVHLERPDDHTVLSCCNEQISGTFRVHLESSHHLNESTSTAECCDVTFNSVDQLTQHCAISHGLKVSKFEHVRCCSVQLTNFGHSCNNDVDCQQDDHSLGNRKRRRRSMHRDGYERDARSDKERKRKTINKDELDSKDAEVNKEHVCPVCHRHFRLKSSLRSHLYRLGMKHDPVNKSYPCEGCHEVFNTATGKRKHVRVVHEGKPELSCSECHISFIDRHRLNEHQKANHQNQKEVQCVYCGKLFASQERLKVHEKFAHVVEEQQVGCDICHKTFPNRERMHDHRRSVHRARTHQCEYCGSWFKNASTLKSHISSLHTLPQEQPLQCGTCGRGFMHRSRLEAHSVTHSEETKFSCRFCGRPNKSKNNNNKHEKRCKLNNSNNPTQQEDQLTVENNAPAPNSGEGVMTNNVDRLNMTNLGNVTVLNSNVTEVDMNNVVDIVDVVLADVSDVSLTL